jgi:hypothetical protein
MTDERPVPDLRVMLTKMTAWAAAEYPELVTTDDVKRVKGATNVLLVMSRVLASICIKAGLDRSALTTMVNDSVPSPQDMTPEEAFMSSGAPEVKLERGRLDAWVVMTEVDMAMMAPKKQPPIGFVKLYQSISTRARRGIAPTDREIGVMRTMAARMRGEA